MLNFNSFIVYLWYLFYNYIGDYMKDKLSLLFKILIVIISGIGLYLNFNLLGIGNALPFFTILSNLFCFILYLVIVILMLFNKLNKNNTYYIFKGMATMSIIITMFVYQFLISPNGLNVYENHLMATELVHLVVPLLIVLDYFIFGEKGNIKKTYPLYWCEAILAYLVFVIIYSLCGGTFNGEKAPYFFLDIEKEGLLSVIMYCAAIFIFYIGCGHIAYVIDNKLGNKDN